MFYISIVNWCTNILYDIITMGFTLFLENTIIYYSVNMVKWKDFWLTKRDWNNETMSLLDHRLQKKMSIILDAVFAVVVWNILLMDFKHLLSIQSSNNTRMYQKWVLKRIKRKRHFLQLPCHRLCLDHHYLLMHYCEVKYLL